MVRVLLEPPMKSARRKSGSIAAWIRWPFLLAAIIALSYSGYVYVDSHVYQAYEDWSFDQRARGNNPTVSAFLHDPDAVRSVFGVERRESAPVAALVPPVDAGAPKADPEPARTLPRAKTENADASVLGRIEIPRLRVHAIVREGVDDKTLRRAVGHVPGTATPGADGNMALAGHRDSFFRGLQDVKKDDRIVMETLDSRYEYVVDSLKIVGPDDVEVLAATENPVLTLVTCYPFRYVGNAPRRFIVRARQVSVQARADNAAQTRSGT